MEIFLGIVSCILFFMNEKVSQSGLRFVMKLRWSPLCSLRLLYAMISRKVTLHYILYAMVSNEVRYFVTISRLFRDFLVLISSLLLLKTIFVGNLFTSLLFYSGRFVTWCWWWEGKVVMLECTESTCF